MIKRALLVASVALVSTPAAAQPAPAQPAPSAEASVAVPREVLERYVGHYALNGSLVTVSITEDNRLKAQLDGQPPAPPLRAVSENEFSADAVCVRLWFEGEGPQAPRIRSRYAGTEAVGMRIAEGADVAAAVAAVARAVPIPIDAAARRETVNNLGTVLRQRYVSPELGEQAAARIAAALAAGEYDALADPAAFAARLNADVSAIAHDKHLTIGSINGRPPPPPPGAMALPRSEAGVVRADRLAGGIGYIEVVAFPRRAGFKPVIDPVMTGLADSTALIIDLRRNIGGLPEGVSYLVSFLLPPEQSVHINDIVMRVAGSAAYC